MPEIGGDQEQTLASCQNEEGFRNRRELHVKTRRGSRQVVIFMSGQGGDQDQT
ncbi:unnamed protein product, partial [Nesidiocoris tenuis]